MTRCDRDLDDRRPASSQVEYGTTPPWVGDHARHDPGDQPQSAAHGTEPEHRLPLPRAQPRRAGNLATGTDSTFTTAAPPRPPAINDVSVTEGNSGSVNAVFTVSLSAASGQAVSVAYATANGTASAGSDYTAKTGHPQLRRRRHQPDRERGRPRRHAR